MSKHGDSHAPARPAGRIGLVIPIIGVVIGVAAGVYWHEPIERRLGITLGAASAGAADSGSGAKASELWTCGMHPQVIQDHQGECPICHMKLTPIAKDQSATSGMSGGEPGPSTTDGRPARGPARRVLYWWDPMESPPFISDKPGKSPMGIELVPVFEEDDATGMVVIDPAVVQNMGVRIAPVTEGPLAKSIRLFGYLDQAEPNIHDVSLRVSGWIRHLHAHTEGQLIEAGAPLFEFFSPELRIAIEELISARRARSERRGAGGVSQELADTLYQAAALKLTLLGLAPAQVEALGTLDRAPETVTIPSPRSGFVSERMIAQGSAVAMGERIMRIVDLSTLWVNAQVFEKDAAFVRVGQEASAEIAARPGEVITGEIIFIEPRVNSMTRSTTVRLAIPNPGLSLRPGMYATVRMNAKLADRAVFVPREGVIDTGESQVAFVAREVGTFEPRRVKLGLALDGGMVQVIEGLAPGEAIVTSGQFLLDSESRLREAVQKFLNQKRVATPGAPTGGGSGAPHIITVTAAQGDKVDAVLAAYLTLSGSLGALRAEDTALDVGAFATAAESLCDALRDTAGLPLAQAVLKNGESMRGRAAPDQRESFKVVSDAMIALIEAIPPSPRAGDGLFVAHCPMAPGSWIQRSEEIANPYYATEMKRCGEVVRAVPTRGRTNPEGGTP